ncbi:MAG: hypothetical protein QCI00_07645 [Candidatus Thermoplasmatota archaeon]|nr:hypothetical protein [Candidatus Thermoplasmatota archaeon]
MKKTNEKRYICKYCGRKMNKIDFEINKGYCGKCREVMDWKQVLDEYKTLNKRKE